MRKKTKILISPIILMGILLMLSNSCKKEPKPEDPIKPTPNVNTYSGSGAYGDLVTFKFNQKNYTYTTYNETTGDSSSGAYTILDGELQGVYRVVAEQDTFFAVELNDKFVAANFPTGNPLNNLSMGISSEIDNSNNMANVAGDYVFIGIEENGYYNDSKYKEWGVITVHQNGIFEGMSYATGGPYPLHETVGPEEWSYGFPLVKDSIEFDGTVAVDPTHKERLTVVVNNQPSANYKGFVYATPTEGVMILDRGVGNGFQLCIKINAASTLANIPGSYKYISVHNDNTPVGGNATISADGSGTYTQMTPNGTIESGTLQNVMQCPHIQNMYVGDMVSTQVDGKMYLCIVGDIFFMIGIKNSGKFAQYGAGAKLK